MQEYALYLIKENANIFMNMQPSIVNENSLLETGARRDEIRATMVSSADVLTYLEMTFLLETFYIKQLLENVVYVK